MTNLLRSEPVVSGALAVIVAVVTLLQVLGVDITEAQAAAIAGVVSAVAALVRAAVTPVRTDG